jgi:hypothetical protein
LDLQFRVVRRHENKKADCTEIMLPQILSQPTLNDKVIATLAKTTRRAIAHCKTPVILNKKATK